MIKEIIVTAELKTCFAHELEENLILFLTKVKYIIKILTIDQNEKTVILMYLSFYGLWKYVVHMLVEYKVLNTEKFT